MAAKPNPVWEVESIIEKQWSDSLKEYEYIMKWKNSTKTSRYTLPHLINCGRLVLEFELNRLSKHTSSGEIKFYRFAKPNSVYIEWRVHMMVSIQLIQCNLHNLNFELSENLNYYCTRHGKGL